MNRIIKLKPMCFALAVLATQACTKDFDGLNKNQKHISDEGLVYDANEGGFLLPAMMNNVVSTSTAVQTQQTLQAESYAGYLEPPGEFISNVNTLTYTTKGIWPGSWTVTTNGVMNNWVSMYKSNIQEKYPDLYAIALILKVMGGQRLVDTFGPYPYAEYGLSAEPNFNTPEECYALFFEDLDWAVAALKAQEEADPEADVVRFSRWDISSLKGEYTSWIKLANSLRLRVAIRLADVDPTTARTQAEWAVDPSNGGLLDATTGSFTVVNPAVNPYYTMTNAWTDTRMSAAIITYMDGFGDPRLPVYATTATEPGIEGEYRGIRPGGLHPSKEYINFSEYNVETTDPVKIMDAAENYFIRAEGALRGWNMGGTAQELYEEGVAVSFQLNGVSGAEEYLQSTSTMIPYVDPLQPDYNSPVISEVTVKWEEGADFETKLEKIITQKWIAMFPEGTEAWSEIRRTGYPKQYHIMEPSNPLLPLGTFIKRLTYPVVQVVNATPAGYAQAVEYLGADEPNVTFYWMKED